MDLTVNTINKKLNKAFWSVETRVDKVFNKVAFPILISFIVMFFVHVDYMHNGKKRDLETLPKQLQTKLSELGSQELQIKQQEDRLLKSIHPMPHEHYRQHNKEVRAEVNSLRNSRHEINKEIRKIVSQAPSKSWAYNLYAALGVIDTKKEV